jgi:hypothetical protein
VSGTKSGLEAQATSRTEPELASAVAAPRSDVAAAEAGYDPVEEIGTMTPERAGSPARAGAALAKLHRSDRM